MQFQPNQIFDYNLKSKKKFAYALYGFVGIFVLFVALYLLFLKNSELLFFVGLRQFLNHVANNISQSTFLGVFYAAGFGGLFFVTISLEAVFINFLRSGINPLVLIAVYLFGLIISYTINYVIGMRLNELCMKLITAKKFYKIKAVLNRYGTGAIFFFNVLPLPSQPLSAILGVFRYNKTKFYIFFLAGQLVKYIVVTIIYISIFR